MAIQQPKQKSFFAKYWWIFVGGGALLLAAIVTVAVLVYLFVLRGDAKVKDLSLSSDSVAYGKQVEAVITVENNRVLDAKFAGVLQVDGKEQQLDEVVVESKETETVKYDLSKLKPGSHTVSIGDFEKKLKILKPAEFTVSGLTLDTSDTVLVGGTLTISAKVKNTGEVKGTYEAKFAYDGSEMDPVKVDVEPGAEETASVSFTVPANGAHEISINEQKLPFTAYNPAVITPLELKLAKTLMKPGEKINFTIKLGNTGDLSGKYPLEVLVNGKSSYTEEITVDGGKEVQVPLEYTQSKAGVYVIQVGDLKQTLRVAVITRPKNGTLLVKTANGGYGKLTLVNGYKDRDAVFVLASTSNPKAPLLTVYVYAGSKAANIKLKDGTYIVYYQTGKNYDSASKRFITNPSLSRFEDTIKYKTTKSGWTTYYTIWTMTINASNGSDNPIDVNDSDFPK